MRQAISVPFFFMDGELRLRNHSLSRMPAYIDSLTYYFPIVVNGGVRIQTQAFVGFSVTESSFHQEAWEKGLTSRCSGEKATQSHLRPF